MNDVLSLAQIDDIVARRRRIRLEMYPDHPAADEGACWVLAEELAMAPAYDYGDTGGCYITVETGHEAHSWNILADGRIIDATADQFGEPSPGIRITAADDPRYDNECDCEGMLGPGETWDDD